MLEQWKAQRFESVLSFGRTKPLVLECEKPTDSESDTPAKRLMVVKAKGLPEVRDDSLFNEAFGNLLARTLGIPTASPALVKITPAFINAIKFVLAREGLRLEPGIGIGMEYLKGLAGVLPGAELNRHQLEQAMMIYAFDLMVQNPDRRIGKPNCAYHGNSLLAFDFEMSFSFCFAFGIQPEPWQVSKLPDIAAAHVFRPALKNQPVPWSPFIERLSELNQHRLETMIENVPNEWLSASSRIFQHVLGVVSHLKQFELELQGSLYV